MQFKSVLLFVSVGLFSSCATIFHGPTTSVAVRTSAPADIVANGDTLRTTPRFAQSQRNARDLSYRHEAVLVVPRDGSRRLLVEVIGDTTRQRLQIAPVFNNTVWLNVFNYGIGILVDASGNRAYTYPSQYVNLGRENQNALFGGTYTRGKWYITAGLPYINFYSIYAGKIGRQTNQAGFVGISLGADYHYADRHSLSIDANAITSIFIPFPAAIDLFGPHEFQHRLNVSLYDNYHLRRFSFGYGVNASRNIWQYRYYDLWLDEDEPVPPYGYDDMHDSHWAAGPIVNAYWKTTHLLKVGVVYRPSLYRFGTAGGWRYGHSISIDFRLHIPVGK